MSCLVCSPENWWIDVSHNRPAEVKMINNISAHFGYLPEEQAAAAVADHIGRFWDPRMKQRLLMLVDSDTTDLTSISLAAAALVRKSVLRGSAVNSS